MIDNLILIGDIVTLSIDPESRAWGCNPYPDGTVATVIGFGESTWGRVGNCGLKPGTHLCRSAVKCRLEDGRVETASSVNVELQDSEEYARRKAGYKYDPDKDRNADWLRDLPETAFWEGDVVRFKNPCKDVRFGEVHPTKRVIQRVNYHHMTQTCNDGSPYPFYDVSDSLNGGWHCSAKEQDLELVERGNVWKHFYGEPLTFADLKEEANFFTSLGHTTEVRNPANGLYKWTLEEVLQGIRDGIVHGFTMGGGWFGSAPSICATRFHNEELGRRVAAETLKGFPDEPIP
jgi:hypothetical protein